MFFNTQSRSTAIDTSLNTTWASSSVLPGASTGNPLDLSNAISQSQRTNGASQSLPTRTPTSVFDPAEVTRGRIPAVASVPDLAEVTRGRTLVSVTSPDLAEVTRGRIPAVASVPDLAEVTRGRTLVSVTSPDPAEVTRGRIPAVASVPDLAEVTRGRTLVSVTSPDPAEVTRGRIPAVAPVLDLAEVTRGRIPAVATVPDLAEVTRGRTLVSVTSPDPAEVTRGRIPVSSPEVITLAPAPLSSFNSVAFAMTTDPGSTPGTALDLGYIRAGSPKTVNDSVSSNDTNDFYRFTVDTDSNLNLRLSGLSADADVEIIRDSNSNGLVDPGEVITRSTRGGSSEEVIDLRGLAGRYYARVLSYNGTNNTNYTLSLSAGGGQFGTAPEPNNSLSQAYDIGTLNGNRNFSGFVSSTSDQNDFYRFNLGTTSNFKLVLSGLSQDADVEVIQDSNFNGLVDPGEVIKASRLGGNSRESIDLQNLAAGSYSVRVLAYGTTNATNYNLFLLGQPA